MQPTVGGPEPASDASGVGPAEAEAGRWAWRRGWCIRLYVAKHDRLLSRILRGTSDANIPFNQLRHLLRRLGFDERIRGDHHIFTKEGVEEILNLQPKGGKAKPYQVKQVRVVILKYRLAGGANEE